MCVKLIYCNIELKHIYAFELHVLPTLMGLGAQQELSCLRRGSSGLTSSLPLLWPCTFPEQSWLWPPCHLL